jgi:predicted acetyltransferase
MYGGVGGARLPSLPLSRLDNPGVDMSENIALIHPTLDLCADFRALAEAFLAEGDDRYRDAAYDVRAFVEMCGDHSVGRNLPADWVPQTTFWLVRDTQTIVGCSRLRHRLTQFLAEYGGHIGFDVRPSERRRGYGTRLLQLTLAEARRSGLTRLLITTDEANVPSRRVMEKNGGQCEPGLLLTESSALLRYWIDTTARETG